MYLIAKNSHLASTTPTKCLVRLVFARFTRTAIRRSHARTVHLDLGKTALNLGSCSTPLNTTDCMTNAHRFYERQNIMKRPLTLKGFQDIDINLFFTFPSILIHTIRYQFFVAFSWNYLIYFSLLKHDYRDGLRVCEKR